MWAHPNKQQLDRERLKTELGCETPARQLADDEQSYSWQEQNVLELEM